MARLQVFSGQWSPVRYELGEKKVIVGRIGADVDLPDGRVSRKHLQLENRDGHWWVEDLQSSNGTYVNGVRFTVPRRLMHEDVVSVVEPGFIFEERDEVRNLELEAAISAQRDDPAPVCVWSDWLLERGDPWGEHLALVARGRLAPTVLSGGWEGDGEFWRGALVWRHGLIDAVQVRSCGRRPIRLKTLLPRLLHHRATRFLRRLQIDITGLGADWLLTELGGLVPLLPRSIETFDLGYSLDRESFELPEDLAAWLPALRERRVFRGAQQATLIAGTVTWPVAADLGIYFTGGSASVRREPRLAEWPLNESALFHRANGTWDLRVSESLQRTLKVNGAPGRIHGLLPGDQIALGDRVFRFEVE
jgi:hypothetical protein